MARTRAARLRSTLYWPGVAPWGAALTTCGDFCPEEVAMQRAQKKVRFIGRSANSAFSRFRRFMASFTSFHSHENQNPCFDPDAIFQGLRGFTDQGYEKKLSPARCEYQPAILHALRALSQVRDKSAHGHLRTVRRMPTVFAVEPLQVSGESSFLVEGGREGRCTQKPTIPP